MTVQAITMSDTQRMLAMLAAVGVPSIERDGRVFVRSGPRVHHFGALLRDGEVSSALADDLLRSLGGSWVQWTQPVLDASRWKGWFAVICRQFTAVEAIESSNVRSKLRRGLKRCRVAKVSIDEFLAHAFEIHDAAVSGYANASAARLSSEAFRAHVERERGFDDLRHYWLVFIEEQAVAYAKTIIHGTEEADYTALKFHPEHLKHYPSYALIHEMNRHYLEEAKFAYVNDGQRSVLHDTNLQDFLVKDLGFERHAVQLRMHYSRGLGLAMNLARLARSPLSRLSGRARAVLELDHCAEKV